MPILGDYNYIPNSIQNFRTFRPKALSGFHARFSSPHFPDVLVSYSGSRRDAWTPACRRRWARRRSDTVHAEGIEHADGLCAGSIWSLAK